MIKNRILFSCLLLFPLINCAGINDQYGDYELRLVVLHTNDYHGTILPDYADGIKMGGIAEIAALIKTERSKEKNLLLLDAGDLTVSHQFISGAFDGQLDIALYNMLGYDAVAFGNNEFQRGAKVLEKQMGLAIFPFLGANVKKADGSYLGLPWIIKDYSGFKVGIFGICTTASKEYLGSGYTLTNEISAAVQAISELKANGADIIIALTHLGIENSSEGVSSNTLAAKTAGIDLIIDGHSHTYLETPLYVNGVPIVSAAEYGKYLGKAVISASGTETKIEWQIIPVKDVAPDKDFENYVSEYAKKVEMLLEKKLGDALSDFEYGDKLPSRQESSIGDLITDAADWYITERLGIAVDFSFINSGTIRKGFKKGAVKYSDINNAIPFNDNLILLEIKGDALLTLFEYTASIPRGNKGFPQISKNARYTVDLTAGEGKLKEVLINSSTINPENIYKVITVDFISGGGDGYKVSEQSLKINNTGVKLRDAVAEYIEHEKTIKPLIDGRIKILE
jgi:5'-nucleotidase/UDP-sugar diphosphatase